MYFPSLLSLHDSIQNPSYKALQKLCWPVLQILLPSTLPCVFCPLYHTGCFFPATWYTPSCLECLWYLSTPLPPCHLLDKMPLSFMRTLHLSPLSHLHSPHPTSQVIAFSPGSSGSFSIFFIRLTFTGQMQSPFQGLVSKSSHIKYWRLGFNIWILGKWQFSP